MRGAPRPIDINANLLPALFLPPCVCVCVCVYVCAVWYSWCRLWRARAHDGSRGWFLDYERVRVSPSSVPSPLVKTPSCKNEEGERENGRVVYLV